jgi:phospholipid/cholesterol/gamma-HCH transport system substrate-binding protein
MSQESRYFKLGLFVLIALALFVVGVIIFGAGKLFEPRFQTETSVSESVQGLDIGADVKYQGVSVGRVNYIRLGSSMRKGPEDTATRVALSRLIIIGMELYPKRVPRLPDQSLQEQLELAVQYGMHVRMASSGITGPTYLELVVMEPSQYKAPPLPYVPQYFYIPSTPSFVTQMKTGIEQLVDELTRMRLADTVNSANALLADLRKAVEDIQIKAISERLASALDEARASATRVKDILSSPEIGATLKNLEATTGQAKQVVASPEIRKFLADLPAISADLKSTIQRVNRIAENPAIDKTLAGAANVGPAVVDLRRALRDLSGILASNRAEIETMIANLRRASVNAAELTDEAKRNPARTLFGDAPSKAPTH